MSRAYVVLGKCISSLFKFGAHRPRDSPNITKSELKHPLPQEATICLSSQLELTQVSWGNLPPLWGEAREAAAAAVL